MSYILVVDDEADIREIFEMILKRSFQYEVILAESGNKALEVINQKGHPKIIISDYNMTDGDGLSLFNAINENKWNIPFVICSTDAANLKNKFPGIFGFIEKPDIIGPAVQLVRSVIEKPVAPSEYVAIRISLLLRWGAATFDVYMKLSDAKYVKVVNTGDAFIPADAERFISKGLQHLYITKEDSETFIETFINNISFVSESESKSSSEFSVMSLEALETVERIAKVVGWKPEVIEAAKHAVDLAVKAVSKEANLLKLLKEKMKDPHSDFSTHVSILSLLSCGFCHSLGWVNESTQMKLGLASLMHDLTVDESIYADIHSWNINAAEGTDKSPEAVKYRNHPSDAASLILSMKNVPSDVDQIVLQHHETKEGNGFPRKLISSRITPMACIFIITEDLITYIQGATNMDEKIVQFLKLRESRYNSGNFKKVFETFRESVEKVNSLKVN